MLGYSGCVSDEECVLSEDCVLKKYDNLIYYFANRFAKCFKCADFDDLVQEGRIGVLIAFRRFESGRVKFHTYAHNYIVGHMQHYIRDKRNLIRTPSGAPFADCLIDSTIDYDIFCSSNNENIHNSDDKFIRYYLDILNDIEFNVIKKVYYEGKSVRDAGRILNISNYVVQKNINSSLKKLRRVFSDE